MDLMCLKFCCVCKYGSTKLKISSIRAFGSNFRFIGKLLYTCSEQQKTLRYCLRVLYYNIKSD